MSNYLAAIWQCRYFWLSLVKSDLRTRYRRSVLGVGWSLLHPIMMSTVLCVVFYQVFHMDLATFASSLLAGLSFWSFVVSSVGGGCACFFQGETYIRQFPAPLAIYPLRSTLGTAFHFAVSLAVAIVASWIFLGFKNVPALLCLVPNLVLIFLFCWSLAVVTGACNVLFSDVQHLTEIGFQILFYMTPIIYPPSFMYQHNLGWLMTVNPLVAFLQLIRTPIVDAAIPSLSCYAIAIGTTALTLTWASVALAKMQTKIIFYM